MKTEAEQHAHAIKVLERVRGAIVETVNEADGRPVSEGAIYMALMTFIPGISLEAYNSLINGLIAEGKLKRGRFPHSLEAR